MLNLASVRELNSRITDKIPKLDIVRFRANIIRMIPASLCVTPTQSPPTNPLHSHLQFGHLANQPSFIEVSGPSPFMEDDWKKVRLGAHVYYAGTLLFSNLGRGTAQSLTNK